MRRAAENGDWGRDVDALDVSEPDAHPRAARTDCSIQSPASHSMLASLCDPAYRKSFLCCAGAGERGRLSENRLAIMWGWSRRTDGQALKGGGRQQAALKTRAKRAQATGEIHVLFTEDGLGLRMAAELGCNAFKLERLAHKPTPQRGPRQLFVQVHV